MKFANIYDDKQERLSIGDAMQLVAIENLYSYMGIDYSEVVRIAYRSLGTYDGEYVILPVSFPFYAYMYELDTVHFSPKIFPVFLGLSTLSSNYSEFDINYLKKYEPIGCRDLSTMLGLRKKGILAYIGGCITETFPNRRIMKSGKIKEREKIFFIDIPKSFEEYVPKEYWENGIFISHTFYPEEIPNGPEEKAKEYYELYIQEAKMVITTRLHAALPCIAAGIPTVWLKDKFSYRFAGVDRLTHIYTKEEYEKIDWDPQPIEYEEEKQQILEMCAERIWKTYNQYKNIYDVSNFFEQRVNREYYTEFYDNTKEMINKYFHKNNQFSFALWGVTHTAQRVYEYLKTNYPNAKLAAVIDKNKDIEFCGVKTCRKEWLLENIDTFCFVCTGAAILESYQFFQVNNYKNFYQCCEDGSKSSFEIGYNNRFVNNNIDN